MSKFSPVLATKCGSGLYVSPDALRHIRKYEEALETVRWGVQEIDFTQQDYPLTIELLADDISWPAQRLALDVPVGMQDVMTFAYRDGRSWASPVVIDPSPPKSSQVSLIVQHHSLRPRVLTAWIGGEMHREPKDRSLSSSGYAHAIVFWRKHAFVWDPDTMGVPFESTWEQVLTM